MLDSAADWLRDGWAGLQATFQSVGREERTLSRRTARVRRPSATVSGGGAAQILTNADFVRAAQRLGPDVDPVLVRALAEKQSGGRSGFGGDGRIIIAFEGHKFRKYTKRIYDQSHPKLSYPYSRSGWHAKWAVNNRDQATAWSTLETAMALDHDAALKSTSFGAFQILGENHQDCGYADVDAFVDLMKSGQAGQLEAFVLFCKAKPGLVSAMTRLDFEGIGSRYNGAAQENYDSGLRKIYNRLKGVK